MVYKKWCFVPGCKNSSTRTPVKKFLCVPRHPEKRKIWFKAVGRDIQGASLNSSLYCCEDHFNLEQDLINYLQYKLMGRVCQARMKSNVVPHIFDSYPDPGTSQVHTAENKTQISIVDQLLNEKSRQSSEIGIQCCDSKSSSRVTRDACSQTNFKVQYRSKATQVSLKDMNRAFLIQEASTSTIKIDVISQPPVKRSRKQIFPSNIDNPSIEIFYT